MGRSYSAKRLHFRGHKFDEFAIKSYVFLFSFYIFTEIRNIMIDYLVQ